MKRIVSIILIIVAFAMLLSSCSGMGAEDNIYDKLTKITSLDEYSSISTSLTTVTADEATLVSNFVYTTVQNGTKIDYSVQVLADFEIENGNFVIPDEMIETVVGYVVVSDGSIVERGGDAAPIDFTGAANYPQFKFKEAFFKDVKNEGGVFEGSVISPVAFLGASISCSNMRVSLNYTDDAIQTLTLTYKSSDGATVSAEYKYQK